MTESGALTGAELVEIVQDAGTFRTTTQAIADLGGGGGNTVNDYATSDTVTGSQTATNIGAGGDIVLTLADDPVGTVIKAVVIDGFAIFVTPVTGTSILFWDGATTQTISDTPLSYLYMTDVGMTATFEKISATQWIVTSNIGGVYTAA